MIFVRDKGQMCNNILQYGHMYAWGREHNRKTVSMRFAYKYQYFHICNTKYHWFITYLFAKWGAALHLILRITFPFTKGQDTKPLEKELLHHNLVIAEGWRLEFPELFLKYKLEIISLFDFKKNIKKRVVSTMEAKDEGKCLRLGVHIRRGDYSRWNDGKYFYNDIVYSTFIMHFIKNHPDKKVSVYISTNDGEVSVEKYRDLCSYPYIYKPFNHPADDLCMLSECDYLIGPPSTYSLVAAMYHDIPLLWMVSSDADIMDGKNEDAFKSFDQLFTNII